MSDQVQRQAAGRFAPGTSGNRAGRPQRGKSLAEVVRRGADARELVAILLSIARDPTEPAATRVAAIGQLCDRGWGKPLAAIDLQVGVAGQAALPAAWAELPREERLRLLDAPPGDEEADGE